MADTAVRPKPLPPAPKERHWLFGSAYLLRTNTLSQLMQFIEKYGPVFRLTNPLHRVAVVTDPEYARYVLLDNQKNYTKSLAYDILKMLLGNGLLTSEGDFWLRQRRLIQPAFHRRKLEQLTAMMVERAEAAAAKLSQYAETGEYFDVLPEMTTLTLDIISKAMFSSGVEDKAAMVGRQITILNEFTMQKLSGPLKISTLIKTPFNRREQDALKLLDEVVYEIIDKRRKEGVSKDDLLSMLIEVRDEDTCEAMSNLQLRDEVMTIFIAGNETSSSALSWMLYLLSQNPEAERKMLEEIDSKASGELNFNTVNEYQYVRQVIEESMRIFPPVWSVGRRTINEDEIGGYRIRKQTNVLVPIIYFHRSSKYWEEPMRFKPERFAPEKRGAIDRYVYFPFGGGPRICIGNNFAMLEMQVILIALYRRFRFVLKEGFKVEGDPLVTLRPRYGVLMKAVKR